jgi:hypothetical protein
MEVGRPVVDGIFLDWMRNQTFKKADFAESTTGVVRLKPEIHEQLTAFVIDSTTEYAHHWEKIAHMLVDAGENKTRKRTPVTRANAIRGRKDPKRLRAVS